jgi:hypothetical protein
MLHFGQHSKGEESLRAGHHGCYPQGDPERADKELLESFLPQDMGQY